MRGFFYNGLPAVWFWTRFRQFSLSSLAEWLRGFRFCQVAPTAMHHGDWCEFFLAAISIFCRRQFWNHFLSFVVETFACLVRSAPIDIRPTRKSRRRTLSSSASTKPTFSSQYEIDGAVLGEGAYGSVYKCTHRITEIEYAVKIIYKKLGQAGRKEGKEKVLIIIINNNNYISNDYNNNNNRFAERSRCTTNVNRPTTSCTWWNCSKMKTSFIWFLNWFVAVSKIFIVSAHGRLFWLVFFSTKHIFTIYRFIFPTVLRAKKLKKIRERLAYPQREKIRPRWMYLRPIFSPKW